LKCIEPELDLRMATNQKYYGPIGNYNASKLALLMFTLALKRRLSHANVGGKS
jgi:NAD(P)-dependent dehydrogenase (short-subunit alcohol dehydrogenase family)